MTERPRDGGPRVSSFAWLNATQFGGALNDNLFKGFLQFFLLAAFPARKHEILAVSMTMFALPFLLFTSWTGVLADRLSKRTIIVAAKGLEILVMALGLAAFAARSEYALYAVMFLMSAQSALFGPSKYGIIPELVERDQLSRANGLLTMYTYLAIILGSAIAPFVGEQTGGRYALAQWACVAVAIAGTATALPLRRTAPAGSTKRLSPLFLRDIWRTLWSIRGDRYLLMTVIATAYFSLLAAYMQMNLTLYGLAHLGLSEARSGYLFFLAALGIAGGSVLAGRLSGRMIEFGIVPIGALALTASALALAAQPGSWALRFAVILLAGAGAGMFVVPLDAFIQARAPRERLGEILGANSFLSWVGVLIAAALIALTGLLRLTPAAGFLVMGLLTLVLTIVTFRMLPDFLIRFIVLVITRLAYRIRVIGGEHIPVDGPALLICNHASYVDALLLAATQQRRLRFVMGREVYDRLPRLQPFFRLMGCIPIGANDPPRQLLASIRAARAALDDGYMVVIFAEGAITRTGNVRAFNRGFTRILKGSSHPIIPVYLGGAWGSIASFYHGRLVRHWPAMLRYPVTVLFGRPMLPTASAAEVRQAVMELSCDFFNDRRRRRRAMAEEFVRAARERWSEPIIADTTGRSLTYRETLIGALALADALRGVEGRHVGLVLPPSAGGALANLAVMFLGRVPVNLNFTASRDALLSAIRQCDIRTIVTSRAFLDKFPGLEWPSTTVLLEDVRERITTSMKVRALLRARFIPARALGRPPGFTADAVATVLFSSGSTGEPKGVMLSHHNILSNIESLRMVFDMSPRDHLCAALPFFHSLGFTATLWYPLLSGLSLTYHANPLDAAKIVEIVRERRSTMLFATPTFLLLYMRKAAREDFRSLRYVIVGAEKLKPRLADAFEERYGVRPMEGYGATELAPVATLSLPDVEVGGVRQKGWKAGSVGLTLPGIAMKLTDPDTGVPRDAGESGLLWIKGPNVMLGYLGRPDLTAESLVEGWYRTGDIARFDEDGFVEITDRLSRFSKIGGEMVPHLGVEEALLKQLGRSDPVLAVTAVPDERKGERLAVLFTPAAGDRDTLAQAIELSGLPNLWKPGRDALFPIEAIPVLGSGKLDLGALKSAARELSGPSPAPSNSNSSSPSPPNSGSSRASPSPSPFHPSPGGTDA